ncbi:MAG: hypothetical protein JXB10_15365 [Pirellulales bacterium]|nr:hypothetical protein [Pirellulales bacterium]
MRSFQKFGLLSLGLFLLTMSACYDSTVPLSQPEQAQLDKGLLGVWKVSQENGIVRYYHLGRAGEGYPSGLMRLVMIDHHPDGEMSVPTENAVFVCFPTTLGKRHFLNVTAFEKKDRKAIAASGWKSKYWIYEYQLDGDKVKFAGMDYDKKKAAVKSGKIRGEIKEKNDGGADVYFTDTPKNLADFITSNAAKDLFKWNKEEAVRVK